ncbi:MAG: transmembrane 220 family protein [Pseudomonadota bacterium]
MRILCGILAALLVLFAVVQWNDPDGPVWMVIYGIGAIWCLIAAFRPWLFGIGALAGLFGLCLLAAIGGMIWFWPQVSNWWDINVWWPEVTGETSREGMGMMVLVVFLLAPAWVLRRARRA